MQGSVKPDSKSWAALLQCWAGAEPHPSGRASCCLDHRYVHGPPVALQVSRAGLPWHPPSMALCDLGKAEITGCAQGWAGLLSGTALLVVPFNEPGVLKGFCPIMHQVDCKISFIN